MLRRIGTNDVPGLIVVTVSKMVHIILVGTVGIKTTTLTELAYEIGNVKPPHFDIGYSNNFGHKKKELSTRESSFMILERSVFIAIAYSPSHPLCQDIYHIEKQAYPKP